MSSALALTWTNTYYLSRALVLTETNIQGTYDISTYDILEYINIYKYIHGFTDSCKHMMQHLYGAHKCAPHSTRIKVQIKGKAQWKQPRSLRARHDPARQHHSGFRQRFGQVVRHLLLRLYFD